MLANILGKGWSAVSVYLFVPLYLQFLGLETYGVVGLYALMQVVLFFADGGLTAAMSREMAALSAMPESHKERPDLLRTIELLYLGIVVALAGSIALAAEVIARHWLNAATVPQPVLVSSIRMMGIALALQFQASLYQGGLMGLQQQVLGNGLQAAAGLIRAGGAVVVLACVSPTLEAFFLWHLIANLVYCVACRVALWRSLTCRIDGAVSPQFRWPLLHRILPYAAGMMGITLVSSLLTQADKLLVSKLFSLEEFACYSLAGAISQIPVMLTLPIVSAVFPRLTSLASYGDRAGLSTLYHRACQMVSVGTIPLGLIVICFPHDILYVWTQSTVVAEKTALVAQLLAAGYLLQALLMLPYNLALAHGWTRLNLMIGVASICVVVPMLFVFMSRFGLVGGPLVWFGWNVLVTPIFLVLLHRKLLPGELWKWCREDVGMPLAAALPVVLLGRCFLPLGTERISTILALGLLFVVSMAVAGLSVTGPARLLSRVRRFGRGFRVSVNQ